MGDYALPYQPKPSKALTFPNTFVYQKGRPHGFDIVTNLANSGFAILGLHWRSFAGRTNLVKRSVNASNA
jgi:hypothetical protein